MTDDRRGRADDVARDDVPDRSPDARAVSVVVVADRADRGQVDRLLATVPAWYSGDVEAVAVVAAGADGLPGAASDPDVGVPARGGRVRVEGIDEAVIRTNSPLLAFVDGSAAITPGALDLLARAVADGADLAYGDHEVPGSPPALAPDHSPERLRSHDHLGPVLLARRDVLERAAGPTADVDGAVFRDLGLRLTEVADRVVHVPHIVGVLATRADGSDDDAQGRAVQAHCDRVGIDADVVTTGRPGVVRVVRRVPSRPSVSVIIPTRGTRGDVGGVERTFVVEAVRSLLDGAGSSVDEFVVVYDADTPPGVLDELETVAGDSLRLVRFDQPFNFSTKINVGAAEASGELLLLLNDDTELIEPTGLDVMIGHLVDPGAGAEPVAMVGAKLLFEDGTLQHGGHVYHHKIHHACFGWPGDSPGPAPLYPLAVERECSGVTAAAALVRRDAFDEVGGFDDRYPLNYNDVDFSLRLRRAGYRIVWTPHASWFHYESRTRVSTLRADEIERIQAEWGWELAHDPYYHPALSPDTGDWTPARPPARSGGGSVPTDRSRSVAPWRALVDRGRERVVSTLLGPPPTRPRGVNLVGYLDATSGLGDRARQLRRVLETAGVRHSSWNLDLTDSARVDPALDRVDDERVDDGVVFDTTIAVVTAMALPGVVGVHPTLLHDVDRVIGYWFWELDEIPDSHRAGIALVDEIWAPTRFVHDAYGAATDLPVELVPLPVEPPRASGADRRSFGFDPGEVVFLTSFDHLSSMQRKHPAGAIEAFRTAFPNGDEAVRLVVKSINGDHRPAEAARLRESAGGDHRIEFRDGYLDAGDQAALIGAADAFVSLHRSEGLGLHVAEAMWLRTPVIATAYSGSVDLTAPSDDGPVAYEVPAELVAVADGGEAYRTGRWAAPDIAAAARAMRGIAGPDPVERDAMVERAHRRMQRQADAHAAAATVASALAAHARPASRRERVASTVRRAEAAARRALRRGRPSTD